MLMQCTIQLTLHGSHSHEAQMIQWGHKMIPLSLSFPQGFNILIKFAKFSYNTYPSQSLSILFQILQIFLYYRLIRYRLLTLLTNMFWFIIYYSVLLHKDPSFHEIMLFVKSFLYQLLQHGAAHEEKSSDQVAHTQLLIDLNLI